MYSFGVVLLELISGRKPVSAEDYGADYNIVHWVGIKGYQLSSGTDSKRIDNHCDVLFNCLGEVLDSER